MLKFGRKRAGPSVITLADQARDQRQWERAAGHYRDALRRNARNPAIWVQYGHVLKESGNLQEAERAYRTAIGYDRSIADSYVWLGYILRIQGKTAAAEAAYLRAVALDPSLEGVFVEFALLDWSEARASELRNMLRAVDRSSTCSRLR
jgi:tetratricopeptide (TPR) repeat protein